ncbi:hypothetical protein ACQEVZ_20130 [Dactylosporangium sp. CA-152071]|uniref:hypothetical protein n=1 Tax=Dactylosporangium sp. CA-152071 TaxID=3239933 RepID=UPI003D929AFE
MSLDTQARNMPGTRAGVFLRLDRFDLITRVLNCGSDVARSRLLDMDPKTIYRARRGVIGEEFIARLLDVMRQNEAALAAVDIGTSFEDVFEVRGKPVTA